MDIAASVCYEKSGELINMSADPSIIDQPWPASQLEQVAACPYCGSEECVLAYPAVKDWSFDCAPGQWSFWRCQHCASLYLNPRPTVYSIGRAYARYYTHDAGPKSWLSKFKQRLINECFSHWYEVNLQPRWFLPGWLSWVLFPLKQKLVAPFGFESLQSLPKGRLMDMGCGSGAFLQIAQQFGWVCYGLELDPEAVKSARKLGLSVDLDSYDKLAHYPEYFDCIVCSHVIEHVHSPLELLQKLYSALKPGGTLLLSVPNSVSKAGAFFGPFWRGLESPRHLSIPAAFFLRNYLGSMGFGVSQRVFHTFPTIAESISIRRKVLGPDQRNRNVMEVREMLGQPSSDEVDFIELTCTKPLVLDCIKASR